ncbi:MAG: hypothetical protein DRP64_00080 [Verrucomicrobia bacterium]|nr:MAG: hypothetical protein DRP64_00080 [Verrucomicrobiota bacterium]RLA43534.1 MAG: hypothetical protein DRQ97_12650 [Gammaproteobacteria bacterium]
MTQKFTNNASTTLANSISAITTSILVTDGSGFPTVNGADPDDFSMCTLENSSGLFEIVKVTEHTSGSAVFVVVRAQEGTGVDPDVEGYAYATSDRYELRLTAGAMNEFLQRSGDTVDGGVY